MIFICHVLIFNRINTIVHAGEILARFKYMSIINGLSSNVSSYFSGVTSTASSSGTSIDSKSSIGQDSSGLKSKLSFADVDNDGICSISDLNSHLNELYSKKKANDASGKTDKNLDDEIDSTKKMINDFQGWAKQLGLDSSDAVAQSKDAKETFMQMLSKKYSNNPGVLVDFDA